MKITHFLSAVAFAIITFSSGVPTADAADDFVTVKHAPAKFAGKPACASKYPAGKGQGAGFRHLLTKSCYSCPSGFKRSLNPNIKAADACVRTTAARSAWSKAAYKGKKKMAKPSKRAFKDPRNGGEWWQCPSNRPRRTAYAVTDKRACATKNILGEKLSSAKFLGKVNRSTPKGAFFDPRRGGEFWACPAGYKRTVFPVTNAKACEKVTVASTKRARAKSRGSFGCKSGAFQNGLENACYTCPATYKRSAVPGTNLHKMKNACVYVTVDMAALKNPPFIKWALNDIKKFEKFTKPIISQAARIFTTKKSRDLAAKLAKAKSDRERQRLAKQFVDDMRKWMLANGPVRRASLDMRKARMEGMGIEPVLSGPAIDVASAARLAGGLVAPRRILPVAGEVQVAQANDRLHLVFPTISVTLVPADISLGFGFTGALMWAWDISQGTRYKGIKQRGTSKAEIYGSMAWSVGLSAGLDMGLELGFWTDPNHKLDGENHGFIVAASVKGGLGMSHWWNYGDKKWRDGDRTHGIRPKYLGMTIFPQVGVSAEVEYVRGDTIGTGRKKK